MTVAIKRKSVRGRQLDGSPNLIDIYVGTRLRLQRTLLGLTQEKLGDAVGLTFQQIQKYERGANRVGASRLFALSRALKVSVEFFFDGMDQAQEARALAIIANASVGEPLRDMSMDLPAGRETLDLVRSYYAIQDVESRKKILDFIKSMAVPGHK